MKQPKKLFTRMLINNWGGISHKVLEFHEYVNLFSGKSGSGKSTVMDAIQVVLYGSVSANFLNKAADDSKNKRSVLSYLRGAQKDGTANRENVDFCSQIVLEIEDTSTHIVTCVGAAFEVGKGDSGLKKYHYFSHSGKIPEDEYLKEGVPYTIAQIRKLIEERSKSVDNRGHGDVNRVYPSKEAYLNTLYDVIFGHVDANRMITMEKSAIALKMSSGTSQFIRDYMFPKSEEGTVATISEQLGSYREIKERVEDLEQRIQMLDEIQKYDREMTSACADKWKTEMTIKAIDIEGTTNRLGKKKTEQKQLEQEAKEAEQKGDVLSEKIETLRDERARVQAELNNSDYGRKEKEYEELKKTMELLANNSRQWRSLLQGIRRWEEEEEITDYVSNRALQLIQDLKEGEVTKEGLEELKRHLNVALEEISDASSDLHAEIKEMEKSLKEKMEALEDLQHDRKPYPADLKKARNELQSALSNQYGRRIEVHILADLFDITDEKWKNAVEGRLGRIKKSMVTDPKYALDAARIFHRMKQYEEIDLINSAAINRESYTADKNSLYEAVHSDTGYVRGCLKRYLGRIQKCETVEELDQVRDGVTPDCYSYSGCMFRHLRKSDYTEHACIGTKISKTKIKALEEEILELQQKLICDRQVEISLREAQQYERLAQDTEQIIHLAHATDDLENYLQREACLLEELQELKDGTLTAELKSKVEALDKAIKEKNQVAEELHKKQLLLERESGTLSSEVQMLQEHLDQLRQGALPKEEIMSMVREMLQTTSESVYRKKVWSQYERLNEQEGKMQEERTKARNAFNNKYAAYGFTGVEHDNTVYDRVLDQCRKNFEPKYKEEFEKQYKLVYHTLRDNVIATIHGEIKSAFRHRRKINQMLSQIRFSDSIYQIDITPAKNENGQFYEMLMAEELDSKVNDNSGFEGQMSLMEDEFFQKYEQKILLLTEKFMPPREEESGNREKYKAEMERFADYRNYLDFNMYEKSVDEHGIEKKNYVDDMAGVDSGGEGQNPKYVALLAGFAMLYMQQSNRDSKIRLVLLDEAFSKMDKERSEVCLKYARELGLQLIVCVPDERLQSLIRNVDCVYGFRRFKNQVTMMHIDKGDYLEMIAGGKKDERKQE